MTAGTQLPTRPRPGELACRICGCTDFDGCVLDAAGDVVELADPFETLPDGYSVCHWVERDLCSACVVPAEAS